MKIEVELRAQEASKKMKTKNKKKDTFPNPQYWDEKTWSVGATVCVTDGDDTKGWGKIISFKDTDDLVDIENKNWAVVELEDGKEVVAYKGYCYKPQKGVQ